MKALIAVGILVLIAMSVSVCAGTTTQGLTSVTVAVTGDSSRGYDYTFTVFNNSIDAFAGWDVLVGELRIYNAATETKATLLAPLSVSTPEGWNYTTNGGWTSNTVISYDANKNLQYFSPPSVAPGGFLLHYNSAFDSNAFAYQTNVFAVLPLTGSPTVPQFYNSTDVNLNSSVYRSKTTEVTDSWWDKPGDAPVGNPNEAVPEASAVVLGSLGLLGPMGYALKRRRVSK